MFIDYYNEFFDSNNCALATKYLIDYTLGKTAKTGQDKVVELTAMDFESTFNKSFLPSMIYIFEYKGSQENVGKVKFIDHVPIILCCTNEGDYITGINFNFIPTDVRARVLDIIYNAYKGFYTDKLSDAVSKSSAVLNEELAGFLIKEDTRNALIKLLSDQTKYPIEKAFRKYDKKKISNSRMIEFDMWKYIPLLVFKDAIRGGGLAELQAEIIANK